MGLKHKELFKLKEYTLPEKVEFCMYNFQETRNDDILLLAKVAERFHSDMPQPHDIYTGVLLLRELPSQDEIARARRKAIAKWKGTRYLPTIWSIAKKRKISRRKWNTYIKSIDEPTWNEMLDEKGLPVTGV